MPAPLPRRSAWFAPWAWKRRTQVVVALMLAIVGYPLIVGPAYWLTINGWMSVLPLEAVYLPLTGMEYVVPSLRDAERWYTALFIPND